MQRPQALSRQVDYDQGAGAEIRQPAQVLRQRHIECVNGAKSQNAVFVQSVTGLEMLDTLLHPIAVDSFRRRRRIAR